MTAAVPSAVITKSKNRMVGLLCAATMLFCTYQSVLNSPSTIDALSEHVPHKNDKRLCTRSQIRRGRWVAATYDKLPYPHLIEDRDSNGSAMSHRTYDWKVSDEECDFTEWDNDDFCALIEKQDRMLFLGDSLMREQYTDLIRRFGFNNSLDEMFHGHDLMDRSLCQKANSPYLWLRVVRNGPTRFRRMKQVISTFRGNIIVANIGVHYTPGDDFGKFMDRLISWLRHWQDTALACQAKSRTGTSPCLVIWKTSVPGHPNCKDFAQPSSNVTEMEALVVNPMMYNNKAEYNKYGGWAMKYQNRIVEQRFAESNLTYAIMDAYTLYTYCGRTNISASTPIVCTIRR